MDILAEIIFGCVELSILCLIILFRTKDPTKKTKRKACVCTPPLPREDGIRAASFYTIRTRFVTPHEASSRSAGERCHVFQRQSGSRASRATLNGKRARPSERLRVSVSCHFKIYRRNHLTEEHGQVLRLRQDPFEHPLVHSLDGVIHFHVFWIGEPLQHFLFVEKIAC